MELLKSIITFAVRTVMGIFNKIRTKAYRNRWLCPKSATGITLFGVVFVRNRRDITPQLLLHEKIHCCQQLEWGYIPFFLLYGIEFVYHYLRLRDRRRAYMAISFEREAYANDHNARYLQKRRWYANYRTKKEVTVCKSLLY